MTEILVGALSWVMCSFWHYNRKQTLIEQLEKVVSLKTTDYNFKSGVIYAIQQIRNH